MKLILAAETPSTARKRLKYIRRHMRFLLLLLTLINASCVSTLALEKRVMENFASLDPVAPVLEAAKPHKHLAKSFSRSENALGVTVGFTGHWNDEETSLVYAKARYMEPEWGIFLSEDPERGSVGDVFSSQGYIYGNSNPTRFTDPDGREVLDIVENSRSLNQMANGFIQKGFGTLAEFNIGGRLSAPETGNVRGPDGGVGGVVGGMLEASTLRLGVFIENNPSQLSMTGMDAGASQIPIMDCAARAITKRTVSGRATSRSLAVIDCLGQAVGVAARAMMLRKAMQGPRPSMAEAIDEVAMIQQKAVRAAPLRAAGASPTRVRFVGDANLFADKPGPIANRVTFDEVLADPNFEVVLGKANLNEVNKAASIARLKSANATIIPKRSGNVAPTLRAQPQLAKNPGAADLKALATAKREGVPLVTSDVKLRNKVQSNVALQEYKGVTILVPGKDFNTAAQLRKLLLEHGIKE